jgi:hypothetical protein
MKNNKVGLCKTLHLEIKKIYEKSITNRTFHAQLNSRVVDQGLDIRPDTPQSVVGLLCIGDWPFEKKCAWKTTTLYAPGGIRTLNPSKWPAADPRLRPIGQWYPHKLESSFNRQSSGSVEGTIFLQMFH